MMARLLEELLITMISMFLLLSSADSHVAAPAERGSSPKVDSMLQGNADGSWSLIQTSTKASQRGVAKEKTKTESYPDLKSEIKGLAQFAEYHLSTAEAAASKAKEEVQQARAAYQTSPTFSGAPTGPTGPTYEKKENSQCGHDKNKCWGQNLDMSWGSYDLAVKPDEMMAKCTAECDAVEVCAGFVYVKPGFEWGGKCYFRKRIADCPEPFVFQDGRDCYVKTTTS